MDSLFGDEIIDASTGFMSEGGQTYEYIVSDKHDMTKLLQRLIDCEWMEITGGPGGWDNVLWVLFKVPGTDKRYKYTQNIFVEEHEPDLRLKEYIFRKRFRNCADEIRWSKGYILKSYEGVPEWVVDKLADIFDDIANKIRCGNRNF